MLAARALQAAKFITLHTILINIIEKAHISK